MQPTRTNAWRRVNPRLVRATLLIVEAVLSKEIAAHVNEPLRGQINKSADATIAFIADDYCGNGAQAKHPPRPLPGPRGLDLAIAVATFAQVQSKAGGFRDELMRIAGTLTQKSYET